MPEPWIKYDELKNKTGLPDDRLAIFCWNGLINSRFVCVKGESTKIEYQLTENFRKIFDQKILKN